MASALKTQPPNKWKFLSHRFIFPNTQNNMFTFAIPINYSCAPTSPGTGSRSYFLVTGPAQRTAQFWLSFCGGGGGGGGGAGHWQVWQRVGGWWWWGRVDDRMSCQTDGPRWAHVGRSLWAKVWRWSEDEEDGLGIHRSWDKHQREYEKLDANRSGSHATPWQKETTGGRLTLCAAFLFSFSEEATKTVTGTDGPLKHQFTIQAIAVSQSAGCVESEFNIYPSTRYINWFLWIID